MDTGDEAAQESYRQMKETIDDLMRWLMGAVRGINASASQLSERTKEIRSKMDEVPEAVIDGDAQAEPERVDTLRVYAANREELEDLCNKLDQEGMEYYFAAEDVPEEPPASIEEWEEILFSHDAEQIKGGVYEVHIPDREPYAGIHVPFTDTEITTSKHPAGMKLLSDVDPVLKGAFGDIYSAEMAKDRVAVARSCAIAKSEGLDVEGKLIAGNKENKIIQVETVKWDPEATILTDQLEEIGVPYLTTVDDKVASIEVAGKNLPIVKEVVDTMIENVRGFDESRIIGYADTFASESQASSDEVLRSDVSLAEAPYVKEMLAVSGIDYVSKRNAEDGIETLYVNQSDIRNHAGELEAVMERGLTQEEVSAAHEKLAETIPAKDMAEVAQKKGAKPARDLSRRPERTRRQNTVERDAVEAKRAAESYSKSIEAAQKTKNKSRG